MATTTATVIEPTPPLLDQASTTAVALLVAEKAIEYGVDPQLVLDIVDCESEFVPQQSKHPQVQELPEDYVLQGDPTREQSFGIFQINLPSHNISYEDAMDINKSIAYAMPLLKETPEIWSCYHL